MIQTTDVSAAVSVLQAGGVIAYPTETIPGLGCLATNENAIRKILQIKQRPDSKGLIILVSTIEQLKPWVNQLDDTLMTRLQQATEIPTTWLIPASEHPHPLLQGDHSKLAIRITRHPTAARLCNLVNQAIVSTSVNIAGEPPAKSLEDIPDSILEQLDLLLSGPEGTRKPSQIRNIETNQIVR